MECIHCKGKMTKSAVPFSLHRKGYHIHWDSVPAWVCAQCGEPYFEPGEVEIMQRAASALDEQQAAFLADAA